MFLIIFLLIFFPSFCNGEQIIRNNWSSEDGNILLYRLTDDTSLAELSLLSDDEDEIKPGVFILESECFQFGSFQPAGIWKFTVLSVPVDNRVLNEKDGLKPDRSKSSLQHPAAAFYTDSGGGGMFQYRDEFLQYSLWQTIFTESYFPLTIGLSHTHLETEPEREDDWYIEEDIPGHDFYCGVSDFHAEFPFSSFQIRSAASFSEYLPPGCSVMPVLTVFYKYHELTMRYWFNSDNWINRNLEKAEWETLWRYYFESAAEPVLPHQFRIVLGQK